MPRTVAAWLITGSETTLTIAGTLLISFGMNLLTAANIWSSAPIDFYDFLKIAFATPAILIGVIFFRFIDDCRRWAMRKEEYVRTGADVTELPTQRESFIDERLNSRYVKKSLVYLIISAILLIAPISLISYRAWHDWKTRKSQQAPHVTLGYQRTAISRHVFIAQEKGFFEKEGLKVDLRPFASANSLMEGIVSNQLDGAALINLQVALTVQAKSPRTFDLINMQVWGKQSFPDYVLVRSDSQVKSLKDLEGQVVGLHPGSATRAFARVVFQRFDVDLSKITFIEVDPTLMPAAISANQVAALYCMDPTATGLIESGVCRPLISNPMQFIFESPVPIAGTAISQSFLQKRPSDADKVIRAIDEAIRFTREPGHEQEIATIVAKYTPVDAATAVRMNASEYWTLQEVDRERVGSLAKRFLELGIIEQQVNIDQLFKH